MGGFWTFVDMNSYFATCEQQDRPELRGYPVGIAPVMADNTSFIAASYEAKAYGIKTGTKVSDARRICPSIRIVEARPVLYRKMHEQIVEAVGTVSPVDQVLSVDEMRIRPWVNEATANDALHLGQQIQDAIRRDVGTWMTASVGIAPNPLLAKVASDFQKPRGLSIINVSDIPHKLFRLELTDWPGISVNMYERFLKAGVRSTEDMYRLDVHQMRAVFGGIEGERWWSEIRGHEVWRPPMVRRQVGHSSVLEPAMRTPDLAWSVACRLVEKAGQRLRTEGFQAGRLWAGVDGEVSWKRYTTFSPTDRTQTFLKALRVVWQHATEKPFRVIIALTNLVTDNAVCGDLLDDPKNAKLDQAMDSLARKYGRGVVTSGSSLAARDYLDHEKIPFGQPRGFR
jgi:DNA polymerase-4